MNASDDAVDVAIRQAQAGDARGFETLFRAFGASVVGSLRARSVSDPDGTANEVFLRVFRTIHTFSGDARRFRSWLYTIVHHAAIDDARRRDRRVREVPASRVTEQAGGDVEAEVFANLAHDRVQTLLRGLSPDQRDVLVLRIVADLSVAETAAVLDKSYEAVKALQRRGLGALQRAISLQEAVPK